MILLSGNIAAAAGGVERSVEAMAEVLVARGHSVRYLTVHPERVPAGVPPVAARVKWGHGPAVVFNPGRLREVIRDALRALPCEPEQVWSRNALVAEVASGCLNSSRVGFIPPGLASDILPFDRVHYGHGLAGTLRGAYWCMLGEPLARRSEARAVNGAHRLIVFSENMRLALCHDYGRVAEAKTLVVSPGVDAIRFRPRTEEDEDPPELAGLPRPRILYSGRLERRKGIALLLDSMTLMPGSSAVVMGDGPEASAARRRIAELRLESRIRLLGHRTDPERIIRACDVFALPSVVEPFGHVMLEALASGLPVVGFTRASGARVAVEDVVRHGQTGVLVEEISSRALAEGISAAMVLVSQGPSAAEACRQAAATYRWPDFVDGVLAALAQP